MPKVALTPMQRVELSKWINREKDYTLSIKSMAEKIHTLRVRSTLDLIKDDYELINHIRGAIKADSPDLSHDAIALLTNVAASNRFPEEEPFWRSLADTLKGASVE